MSDLICTKCLLPGEFYKNAQAKHGRTHMCKTCIKAKSRAHYESNKESHAMAHKEWVKSNAARNAELKQRWAKLNDDKVRAKNDAYVAANREKVLAAKRAWQKANPGKSLAATRRYQLSKLKRTPPWADLGAIREIYEKAAALGLHVDHEIPLRGKLVSGLHVQNNLKCLTPFENMSKSNRFDINGATV